MGSSGSKVPAGPTYQTSCAWEPAEEMWLLLLCARSRPLLKIFGQNKSAVRHIASYTLVPDLAALRTHARTHARVA